MNECDICGSTKNITPGRWIFYCPKHKQNDWEKTYDNEVAPGDLENYAGMDGQLAEMMEANL